MGVTEVMETKPHHTRPPGIAREGLADSIRVQRRAILFTDTKSSALGGSL